MIFTLQNLKKFVYSIKNKKIKEIYIKNNQLELIINKNKQNIAINSIKSKKLNLNIRKKIDNHIKDNNENINDQFIKDQTISKDESEIYSTIISPMVGTFYRSPAPNEAAFIEKNDIVNTKQTVCIIEAMKLMNEIESEVNGEIIEILVNDGDIVDCGQPLMKVKI